MRKTTRLLKREDGVSALEFAILAPILIAFITAIIETGLITIRMSLLQNATARAARFVYIGAATDGTVTKKDLEEFICQKVNPFYRSCIDDLNIELTPINSLSDVPDDDVECRDRSIEIEPQVKFTPGIGGTIVYMRACLTMDIIVPGVGIGLALPKTGEGRYQTVSSIAFQNEPF